MQDRDHDKRKDCLCSRAVFHESSANSQAASVENALTFSTLSLPVRNLNLSGGGSNCTRLPNRGTARRSNNAMTHVPFRRSLNHASLFFQTSLSPSPLCLVSHSFVCYGLSGSPNARRSLILMSTQSSDASASASSGSSSLSAPVQVTQPKDGLKKKAKKKPKRRREEQLLLLSLLIGLGTGAAVTLFKQGIHIVIDFMYGDVVAGSLLPYFREYNVLFVPLLGGILVGLLRFLLSQAVPGGALRDGVGLASLLADVDNGIRTGVVTPISRALAAVITLGTGCSLGPEGPAVELGVSVSRWVGQLAKVSVARQRLLAAAGAAAGVAAGFNAPIAGVFFAQEVVLPREKTAGGGTQRNTALLLASAVSGLVAQIGLGANPAFQLPLYELKNAALELPLYMGLGILVGVAAIVYSAALRLGGRLFKEALVLRSLPRAFHPAIGGLACGVVAVWFPQILFFGYDTLDALLADVQFPLSLLLTLIVLKPALTAISLGSGLVGGTFAPTMFLGATLGASYNKILEEGYDFVATMLFKTSGAASAEWFSSHFAIAGPPAYSIVGMAAALAAVFRAPLTSFLLLFELTRDYRIILPLMASVGLASWLVESVEVSKKQRSRDKEVEQDAKKRMQVSSEQSSASIASTGGTAAKNGAPSSQKRREQLETGGTSVSSDMKLVLDNISVSEALVDTSEVVRVHENDSIELAVEKMAAGGTSFALVVREVEIVPEENSRTVLNNGRVTGNTAAANVNHDQEYEMMGIVTLNDVDRFAFTLQRRNTETPPSAKERNGQETPVTVRDIYTTEALGLDINSTLSDAYELLITTDFQQIPVFEEADAVADDEVAMRSESLEEPRDEEERPDKHAAVVRAQATRPVRVARGAINIERIKIVYQVALTRESIRSALSPVPEK